MTPARFLNRPLALLPAEAEVLRGAIEARPPAVLDADPTDRRDRDYAVAAGIAVVPIMGALSHGSRWSWYDETSYDSIRRSMAHAIGNPEVRAVAMHINSPGGDVTGCFDLADAIYDMRGVKPIWAILDENAYSAAYALASAADHITVPRTGGTGSIGVIGMHADISKMLKNAGIKITTITYGAHKAEGSPLAPLPGDALARMQARINEMGEMFVAQVARNRGISAETVRATEAGTFMGQAGVDIGLADEVLSPDQAFLALLTSIA